MNYKISAIVLFIIFLSVAFALGISRAGGCRIEINGIILDVKLAKTLTERKKGLSGVDRLGSHEGMLFIHPEEQYVTYWAAQCKISLDIAYIDGGMTIREINTIEPGTEKRIKSKGMVKYVLEVNKGFFEKNNIKARDRLKLLFNGDESTPCESTLQD